MRRCGALRLSNSIVNHIADGPKRIAGSRNGDYLYPWEILRNEMNHKHWPGTSEGERS